VERLKGLERLKELERLRGPERLRFSGRGSGAGEAPLFSHARTTPPCTPK
jgi:hypothetical protein